MRKESINRRKFIRDSALTAGALGIAGTNVSVGILSLHGGQGGIAPSLERP